MKKLSTTDSQNLRKVRNKELLQKMKNGEKLMSFDSQASWFPPRPPVKKDDKELSRLFGTTASPKVLSKKSRSKENGTDAKASHLLAITSDQNQNAD